MSHNACELKKWVMVSSNAYQLKKSPNLVFPSSQQSSM